VTSSLPLLCDACARFDGKNACTSFPDGIPEDILVWSGDHRESRHGEEPFLLAPDGVPAFAVWLEYSPSTQSQD
jgi:hypothetical protein